MRQPSIDSGTDQAHLNGDLAALPDGGHLLHYAVPASAGRGRVGTRIEEKFPTSNKQLQKESGNYGRQDVL